MLVFVSNISYRQGISGFIIYRNCYNTTYMQITIANQYKIVKKIGAGSFGEIFQGVNTKKGNKVAIKLEPVTSKYPQLKHQAKILQYLLNSSSTITDKGLPNIYTKGQEGDFNYMIMDLLGPSLESLLTRADGFFSMKTTLMLGDQMLKRIEYLHSKGILHRDIKPQNFLISDKKDRKIYLIDFGLSKRYLTTKNTHIQYEQNKSMVGTIRFSSLNSHYGIEQTRRDDLQSWFFCLYYFFFGKLPWQGVKAVTRKQKYEKIMAIKIENRPEVLCQKLPNQLKAIFASIKDLKFEEKPNYEFMKNQIQQLMRVKEYQYDFYYDWQVTKDMMSKYETSRK